MFIRERASLPLYQRPYRVMNDFLRGTSLKGLYMYDEFWKGHVTLTTF
jgi:hypothetical protein